MASLAFLLIKVLAQSDKILKATAIVELVYKNIERT
jgi:hypothetical protein